MSKEKKLYHLGLTVRSHANAHCYAVDEDEARRIAERYDGVMSVDRIHELKSDEYAWGDLLNDDSGVEEQNVEQSAEETV